MPSVIKIGKSSINSRSFTSLSAGHTILKNEQKVDLNIPDEEYYSSAENVVDESMPTVDPNKYSEYNKYTPEGKVYFGTPGVEVVDPTIGLATLGMGTLSAVEGLGNYVGNNFIALSSILNMEEDALGIVNSVGDAWSSLFEEQGVFSELNDMSLMKYQDDSWKIGSMLGHAVSVGAGRYFTEEIPYVGPAVAFALTAGDGYGSAYRNARANGTDPNMAGIIALGNGLFQGLSFSFEGVEANIAIGAAMPFLDTLFLTLGETSDEDFLQRYIKNFEANGGFKAVGISIMLYGANSYASMLNGGSSEVTEAISKDVSIGINRLEMLQETTVDAFDTPFITTAVNAFLNTIIPNYDAEGISTQVPSTRPI